MKCTIPEISWHNRDPVLSVDIQCICNEEFYRLASGGADCHVLIWYLKIKEFGSVNVEVASDLTRHQKAVNVVRWSPSGKYLATGDDDANIIIWNLKTDNVPLLEDVTSDKEIWLINKILRGHKEDVYDISWSPNGLKLLSGSIDNTAIMWNFPKGTNDILSDHKGFVQGVAWDPKGQYVATLSSDRICRVFDSYGKNLKARIYKGQLPVPTSHVLFNKELKYFHDDRFKSYFRRLSFSPDGNLLVVPSGCIEVENYEEFHHATFIFTIDSLAQPIAMLPSPKQVTIAVRCCPILFELHSEGVDPVIVLPYRIIIAVATDSDIILYDTQQLMPFAHFQKIHYTRITDLAWSSDGLILIASSTDGFCTLITFELNELGVQYIKEDSDMEDSNLDIGNSENLNKSQETNNKSKQTTPKTEKLNILKQWATPKHKELTSEIEKKQENKVEIEKLSNINTSIIKKRIVPIKIADIKKKNETPNKETKITQNPISLADSEESTNSNVTENRNSETPKVNIKEQTEKNSKLIKNKIESKKSLTPTILKFFQINNKKSNNSEIKNKTDTEKPQEVIEILDSDDSVNDIIDTAKQNETSIASCSKEERITSSEKENVQTGSSNAVTECISNAVGKTVTTLEQKPLPIKIPRRIPFITLSSPKRKKKDNEEQSNV